MHDNFMPVFGPAGCGGRAIVLCFVGNDLLVMEDGRLPPPAEAGMPGTPVHRHTIGKAGDTVFEMRVWPTKTPLPPHLRRADHGPAMAGWPQALVEAACRGRQLATWLGENRFCGACGHPMETDAVNPARLCPACGFAAFPRLSPVGIVLVSRGDEILLARSPHFTPGIYSALAGYVEAGESLEACLHREVREEVGIEIRNLRWFGSQSWPRTCAMMLGFHAQYAGGELTLQQEEIEDAQWFRRDRLPPLPHPSTIAYRLITAVPED